MKKITKHFRLLWIGLILLISSSSFKEQTEVTGFSLTVEVKGLRNSNGVVVFALYNREDAFPDENYKKYFKILTGRIMNGTSSVMFENLPQGKYAVNVLHDENNDGRIKKGLMLPLEGIGFSNYQSIGLTNRPSFDNAAFDLDKDLKVIVKVIYM
ncbi:DUF2141 domain-containing protein [bacterium]|nr:MAG: DUF2141 domain-containing protein [bacterium]